MRYPFIFLFAVLVAAGVVLAVTEPTPHIYYTFDDADMPNSTRINSSYDNIPADKFNEFVTSGVSGKFGEAWSVSDNNSAYVNTTTYILNSSFKEFAVSMWIYPTAYQASSGNHYNTFFSLSNNTRGTAFTIENVSGNFGIDLDLKGANGRVPVSPVMTLNNWYHIVVSSYDASGTEACALWVNGVKQGGEECYHSVDSTSYTYFRTIGTRPFGDGVNYGFIGYIDDVCFWSGANLTNSTIQDLYNGGTGATCGSVFGAAPPATPTNPPSWVSPTPDDGEINNTAVITLNASCGSNTTFMWFGTEAANNLTLVLDNSSIGYYTTPQLTAGTYNYTAACYNLTDGLSANTSIRTYVYDNLFPAYGINEGNEFSDALVPVTQRLDAYDDLLEINFNFSDERDLFAWELNITRYDNGSPMYYDGNDSLSGTLEVLIRNINVSSWSAGYYILNFSVSDSHTNEKIEPYVVKNKKSEITFETTEKDTITIQTTEPADITADKLDDRYTFTVSYDDGLTKERTFIVQSKCRLSYREESGYKAHFSSSCGTAKDGGNWIDFEGVGGAYSVVKKNDKKYEVTITGVPPVAEFHSIGGLNVYNAVLYWYRATATVNTQSSAFLNYTTNSNLSVTFGENQGINNISVTLDSTTLYPSSVACLCVGAFCSCEQNYSVNLTSPASAGSYIVQWLVNTSPSDLAHNDSRTSVIYSDWNLTACSAAPYNVTRITYKSYFENTPTVPLNQTFEIYGSYWLENESITKTLNLSFSQNDTFNICIYPSVSVTVDVYSKFNSSSYTHRHYIQNTTINNGTVETVNIYNTNSTTGLSLLRITARQESTYSYFLNTLGVLQRFYVGEGVWRSVQMDRSGDYGLINFDINELTTDYRILYYDRNNNLLLQTQSVKFSCSSGICDVTQLLNPYESASSTSAITTTYTYDNVTNILYVNWTGDGLLTKTVNITVTHETLSGQSVACSDLQTGNSGTFSCNVSLYNSNFLVTLFDVTQADIILNEWVTKSPTRLSNLLSLGEQALWSFGILLTVTAAGLFSPAGVIVMSTIGLIMVTILGIMTPLTLTTLFVAAIIGFVLAMRLRT